MRPRSIITWVEINEVSVNEGKKQRKENLRSGVKAKDSGQ